MLTLRSLAAELKLDVFTIDFEILVFLCSNGAARIDEIRRNVRGSPGAVSYKIRALIEVGLVSRRTSDEDRRSSFYELSERGRLLLNPFEGLSGFLESEAVS